jgi:dienelactone hydrolase
VTSRDIRQEPARAEGLVGELFVPTHAAATGGVVVLGGSEGGLDHAAHIAAWLACHGVAGLALAYFGVDGLPRSLAGIRVEYVLTAARWLKRHPTVGDAGVGLLGVSRGAELALLAGSLSTDVRPVVGFAASHIRWPGVSPGAASPVAAWTYRGAELAYGLPSRPSWTRADAARVLVTKGLFLDALADQDRIAAATTEIERIHGPVLLVSGGDDAIWPSQLFAELAMSRLADRLHLFADEHLNYPHAGHGVGTLPGLAVQPTLRSQAHTRLTYQLGGSGAANARSGADAWPRVLAFLARHLRPERTSASAVREASRA